MSVRQRSFEYLSGWGRGLRGRTVTSMTETWVPESVPLRRRVRLVAVLLVVVTVALASLVMTVSYGLALEYGDTAATDARIAAQSLRDWGIGVVVVVGFAGWVIAAARRSRGRLVLTGMSSSETSRITWVHQPRLRNHGNSDGPQSKPPCEQRRDAPPQSSTALDIRTPCPRCADYRTLRRGSMSSRCDPRAGAVSPPGQGPAPSR